MEAILAILVEICFGSFTMTLTIPAAVAATQITTMPVATPISDPTLETHLPKTYGIVQGMEHVISMMEDTLQICERAQRSTQAAPPPGTFPFGLRSPSDVYARQEIKSS
jgi:hypothetical protein